MINNIKKILFFTFLGPFIGSTGFYFLILISGDEKISDIPIPALIGIYFFFILFGYALSIIPAFFVGLVSILLKFNNKWKNYFILFVSSIIICYLYYNFLHDIVYPTLHDIVYPTIIGLTIIGLTIIGMITSLILGYFIFIKNRK